MQGVAIGDRARRNMERPMWAFSPLKKGRPVTRAALVWTPN